MATIITKVLVRIGDHDVLFAANKDGVLVPNENGLKVIRDYYGYEDGCPIDCYLSAFGEVIIDGHQMDLIPDGYYTVIDTKKGDE